MSTSDSHLRNRRYCSSALFEAIKSISNGRYHTLSNTFSDSVGNHRGNPLRRLLSADEVIYRPPLIKGIIINIITIITIVVNYPCITEIHTSSYIHLGCLKMLVAVYLFLTYVHIYRVVCTNFFLLCFRKMLLENFYYNK